MARDKLSTQRSLDADNRVKEADSLVDLANENERQIKDRLALANSELAQIAKDTVALREEVLNIKKQQDSLRAINEEAERELKVLQSEADSVRFMTLGKLEANKAQVYYRLGELDNSENSANLAIAYLTDSVKSSAEIQVLYDVYTDLLYDDETIFNDVFRETDRKWRRTWRKGRALEDILLDTIGNRDQHPIRRDSILNGEFYSFISWDDSSLSKRDFHEYILSNSAIDEDRVTAIGLDPKGELLAVGYQDGMVEVWRWLTDDSESTQDFLKHAHRITSIAFSPSSDQIAMASIDEGFSIYSITNGRIDPGTELIHKDNGIRSRHLFFWNEDVLVTIGWKSFAKPWATSVRMLKEIKDNF